MNKALRYVYKIRYPDTPTCKSVLEMAKMKPINQTIYWRSQKIWDKIERGIAADISVYNEILKIERFSEKSHFKFKELYP